MTSLQKRFIETIAENEWDVFSKEMILSDGRFTPDQIKEVLRYMLNNSELVQIEKGKYRRMSFSDEKVIGCFLVKDGGIAYWSALNMHGLTEQFPNKMFIQTSQWKVDKIISGAEYKFVQVKKSKITGYQTLGLGNHQYRITDIEKTIVDCFDLPEYSGGYFELIRAFYKVDLDAGKLVKYCNAVNNISVTKRIGYLGELFEKRKFSKFTNYARKRLNQTYTLLDGYGLNEGEFNKRWQLRLNIPENSLIEISQSIY